jgi:subtilisin family serine protease
MKMITIRKNILSASLITLACLSGFTASAKTQVASTRDHQAGELIVKLKNPSTALGKGTSTNLTALQTTAMKLHQTVLVSAVVKSLGAGSLTDIHPVMTDRTMQVIRLTNDSDLQAAMKALKADPSVEYVEPNVLYHAFDDGIPNDPDFGKLWGMKNTGQTDEAGQLGKAGIDINIVPVWKEGIHGSRNVVVAVVDTGIDWTHPDLAANLYTNPGEAGDKGNNGIDDDKNGFIDDIHGWNFVDNSNNSRDDNGHGSHCSGTIGGVGNNQIGVAGVNWEVSLMPVKFLDSNGGGNLENAVNAVNYAKLMKVNMMSNSWGGGPFTQGLFDAIKSAKDAGILFLAASGNDGSDNDGTPTYPASYQLDNIVGVAATDNLDKMADFSNWGKTTVHLAAPGVNVYSTSKDGGYETLSGTSMATPHVAGVAALLLSANPSWTYSQIKDRLIMSVDYIPSLKGKMVSQGRLNAYNALHGIPSQQPSVPDPKLWVPVPMTEESAHPYLNNQHLTFSIKHPGAKFIRVHFDRIDTEAGYDKITILTPGGEVVDTLSGQKTDVNSEYVSGEEAEVHFDSDADGTGWGYHIDRIDVIMNTPAAPAAGLQAKN